MLENFWLTTQSSLHLNKNKKSILGKEKKKF